MNYSISFIPDRFKFSSAFSRTISIYYSEMKLFDMLVWNADNFLHENEHKKIIKLFDYYEYIGIKF